MPCSCLPLRKAQSSNSTDAAFSAKIPTLTEPTGTGVFDLLSKDVALGQNASIPRHVLINPYGTDANDETFSLRLWGWSKTQDSTPLYIPTLITELAVTLGNISAAAIGANHFMADTITVTDGAAEGPGRSVISPEGDVGASALIHLLGCRYIEFAFMLGTGAAMNAYWRGLDD